MVYSNQSRLLVGLLLLITVFLSFIFNLDYLLIFLIFICATFDFYKIKVFKNLYLIISPILVTLFFLFIPDQIYKIIFFLQIILITLIIFSSKYKIEFFLISVYAFCLILFYITSIDRNLLYLIIFISFFNDTVAYIFGKTIGGPLILPNISPKKTWSGTVLSISITSFLLFYINSNVLLSLIIAIFLFIGDIFFSYIKRYLKIKDFSSLLGGHGGMLDRLDSMYFIPVILNIYLLFFK